MVPLSVLDLSPITDGSTAAVSFRHTLDLAQHAERWGYTRYWIAEHHNMPGIASAATAVVIGARCGGNDDDPRRGGRHHAAEPRAARRSRSSSARSSRCSLAVSISVSGARRAPISATAHALRRTLHSDPDAFPHDVLELMSYFHPEDGQTVRAVPGSGLDVPIWILGSSLFGAQVAAALGLPFAFASHFAAAQMMAAIAIYRERFRSTGVHRTAAGDAGRQRRGR